MKVIISHDVDHVTVWEHWRDGIIPKFIVRTLVEYSMGFISTEEMKARIKEFFSNKWNYIDELMEFDKSMGIPSTFFVAVNNGKGLSYSLKNAKYWINRIKSNGFDVGVHGICYKNTKCIKREYETFRKISGLRKFGIRMHYLRLAEDTLKILSDTGYVYDSSVMALKNPFKISNMWEFPLHIMDSSLFEGGSRFAKINLEQAREITLSILEKALHRDIEYFTVLHHDRLFSNAYENVKKWYIWFIEYLRNGGYEFVSYTQATNNWHE